MDSNNQYEQLIVEQIKQKLPLNVFPKHDNHKFIFALNNKRIDKVYEDGEEIGFLIKGDPTIYEFDEEYGFFEINGCYYNSKYQPAGWWVLDRKGKEHFYNIQGILEAQGYDDSKNNQIQEHKIVKKELEQNYYDMSKSNQERFGKQELQQQIDELYINEKQAMKYKIKQ